MGELDGRRDFNPLLDARDPRAGDERITIALQRHGDAVVVVVDGEVDLATGARMNEVLAAAVAAAPATLVVDLERVSFFTSVGLTALALGQRAAVEADIAFRVVATGRAILRPLQITGMAAGIAIYPTLAQALAGDRGDPPNSACPPQDG
ncbi:MAG TPA: STAS domain-containing protein [Pseudonocardia sp.]